jgi:hypothetical protein
MQQSVNDRMVEQVLAHRQLRADRDAERLQQGDGPDAGALQDGRRMDGAGTENYIMGRARRAGLAVHADPDAAGVQPVAFKGDGVDQGIADDVEIGAATRRLQIAVIGGDPQSGLAVDGIGRDAGAGRRVVILTPAIAESERGRAQRPVDIAPIRDRSSIHRDRTAITVIGRVGEILVGFELAEIGQDLVPRPARAARGRPAVDVVGHGADGDLAVDRGAAAHGAAAPEQQRLLPLGPSRQELRPTEVVIADGAHRIRDADVFRCGRGAQILPGFEQQHAMRRVFAQARGQRRSGGTPADDDRVVFVFNHVGSLPLPALVPGRKS